MARRHLEQGFFPPGERVAPCVFAKAQGESLANIGATVGSSLIMAASTFC
jgi:hypothetical protein